MRCEASPIISGEIYKFIKEGYTGGIVEVYRASSKNIYSYDINSLYPYAMHRYDMPVGQPTYFDGDISLKHKNPFGFFEVSVEAPVSLNVPILQHKINTSTGGIRTLTPVGTWKGVYFSEEIKNAEKAGYKFTIHRGYLFERENIFKVYVEKLYDMKKKSKYSNPAQYMISKLLLNTLYGRFGMNPDLEITKFVSDYELKVIINTSEFNITKIAAFGSDKNLVSYFHTKGNDSLDDDTNSHLNISVPISAAITS